MIANASADRPLSGMRVLVTRARSQASDLSNRLSQLGATPIELPTIEIVSAPVEPIDAAILRLDSYDWIVFTSVNGVEAFLARLDALNVAPQTQPNLKVAAIGRATAARLTAAGIDVDFIPDQFVAESVVAGLVNVGISGQRVLLPRAEIARDTLPAGLRAAGATVDVVVAYRTQPPAASTDLQVASILADHIDLATFASPSSVRNFVSLLDGAQLAAKVVCIGPVTAEAARAAGLTVDAVADEYSIPGLVESIVRLIESNAREVPNGPTS